MDKETRSLSYKQEPGKPDDPKRLLYQFDIYPDLTGMVGANQFTNLINSINNKKPILLENEDGEKEVEIPDEFFIDNVAMFQEDIAGWCQKASGAQRILEALRLEHKFSHTLKHNFRVGDPMWWTILKNIQREFILTLKRNGIDVVLSTQTTNVWKNYGMRGYDKDGKPNQRILGKTAKVWDSVMQVADVIWNLDRMGEDGQLKVKPTISIDPFKVKNSIVGLPMKFEWKDWDTLWDVVSKRGIPDKEETSKITMPEVEYQEGDPESNLGDPLEEGREELVKALTEDGTYQDRREIAKTMKSLGLTYTLSGHEDIEEALRKHKE